MADFVDVVLPGGYRQIEQGENVPLPIRVEHRLVLFTLHRAETLHPAQIMDPVHRVLQLLSDFDLGHVGTDHRITGYELGEPFFAPAVRAGRPHR